MLLTTRAVLLKTIRHGDSSVIAKAYTEQLGTRSFLVRTGRKSGAAPAALQALSRLEVITEDRPDRELLMARGFRLDRPYKEVGRDPLRTTLALFVQEVLYRILRGESADHEMFAFVEEALEVMDSTPYLANYPLVFLINLTERLGFQPRPPLPGEDHFDPIEGSFVRRGSVQGQTFSPPLSSHLAALLPITLNDLPGPTIPAQERRALLDHILLFFRLHVDGTGDLRSPMILRQVLG